MVQSRYTWTRFAAQPANVQERIDAAPGPGYLGGGQIEGVWADISSAFLKQHEDILDALLLQYWAQRTVSWNRGPNGEYFLRTTNLPMASAKTFPLIYLPELGDDGDPVFWPDLDERANPTELLAFVGIPRTGDAMTQAVYEPFEFSNVA